MSACLSPGAHMAPNVTEPQCFLKAGCKRRKAHRPGKCNGLDAARPSLFIASTKQGRAQTPLHPTESAALVLKAVQSVSKQHCCCLCCPQDKQMLQSCTPSTGASCTMGVMEQLLPDVSIAWLAPSHRLRAADDSGHHETAMSTPSIAPAPQSGELGLLLPLLRGWPEKGYG